ncbi:MAG TPA: hypothetical protein VIM89_18025 [Mucilaginibacter sp.]
MADLNHHQPIAIAVICKNPHPVWLEFLSKFKAYDTYVIIDDDTNDLSSLQSDYPNVHLILVNGKSCELAGFTDTNSAHFKKVNGWDKALYYFAVENTSYQRVWFFEEDVFFYNEDTIKNIDKKFPASDLLTAPYKISTSTSKDWWWWPMINIPFEQPWYNAMVCGIRVSGNLLDKIKAYARENRRLFYLEVLFPTLAIKNNLVYHTPKQLEQIYFRYDWRYLSKSNIFHPVKNIESHPEIRTTLSRNNAIYSLKFHLTDIRTRWTAAVKERIKLMIPENLLKKKEVYEVQDS